MARTLYEFCARWNISVKKAKLMNKEGDLRLSGEETLLDEIRLTLKTGSRRLSVAQLVYLVDNPGEILELGKYGKLADEQVSALCHPEKEPAPRDVAAQILTAYDNEPEAVEAIAKWMASIIPAGPVPHAFMAVRLLLGVPENVRKYDFPRVQRVFMHARNHPALKPHWFTVREGSRNVTYYQLRSLDL